MDIIKKTSPNISGLLKSILLLLVAATALSSCGSKAAGTKNTSPAIKGTWQLLTATHIEKGDTVVTDYTKKMSFIKIINDTHFAFLQHDLNKGKDSSAVYVSGGGRYSLNKDQYTEKLEYCSAREWEGNDFAFKITLKGDTLIQNGVEKVEAAGVNRINIEKYIRVK